MNDDIQSLQRQLDETQENLRIVTERMAQYVLQVDVPLQLVKEKRRLEGRLADLEALLKIEQAIAGQEGARGILPDDQIDAALAVLQEKWVTTQARLTGDGAIAQGGSVAAGEGGVAVRGNVSGSIIVTGGRPEIHVHDGTPRPNKEALLASYLSRLVDQVRWLSLSGVDPALAADVGRARLSLAHVYTALDTLETERPERAHAEAMEEMREPRRVPVVEVMSRERHLVLLGDPGSGKSTFINFVTLCLAGEGLGLEEVNLGHLGEAWTYGWLLPVRVVLRDFVARGLPPVGERATGDHLWRFLKAELGETLAAFTPLLCEHLQEKGGLVLLDGFDEVPEAERRRQQVMDAVQGFAGDFARCRFLLTSRTYAWQRQKWRLPGFAEVVLATFSDEQIETFIERWYAHVSALRRGEMSAEDAQGRATLLKYAVEHTPGLRELAHRPLLLTLMASLHAWRGGSLPEKREQLYNDTLDLLLNVWEQPKVVRDARGNKVVVQPAVQEWLQAPRDGLLKTLERLGYEAHAGQPALQGTADVSEAQLAQALWEVRGNPDLRRERIVEYIQDRAGLLVPRGVGVYTFPHRTFQEYLAARYLTEKNWPEEMAGLVLEEPERWQEAALLAAAKAARGASYAVWGLVEALIPEPPPKDPDPRAGWAAFIGAAALIENGLHESIPRQHAGKVARLRCWLVAALEKTLLPPVERARAGDTLAQLGDPRFRADAWYLPDEPLLGFVQVPAGPFRMGTRQEDIPSLEKEFGESLWYEREVPQHKVELPVYYIARYPVTHAQYWAFVRETGHRPPTADIDSERPYEWKDGVPPSHLFNHPVVLVTWYDAMAYCRWLTERLQEWEGAPDPLASLLREQGWRVRLPSEAEWEKAARGTDVRIFPWGGGIDSDKANYGMNIGTTSAVGCFPGGASPYGVQDLSGNVWEWCATKWQDSYADYRDDNDPEGSDARVLRGGAFNLVSRFVRCAFRLRLSPDYRGGYLGFRVVVSPGLTSDL